MQEVIVKKSRNGLGIVAIKEFTANRILFEVKGKLISCEEDDEIDKKIRDNTFRFDKNLYLSPSGELGDFLNHSCEPNSAVVKEQKKLFIKSIVSIKKNNEILIDYSTILAADDFWSMECNCGSKTCREKIGQFRKLPLSIRKYYLSMNMVPAYILKIREPI